MSVQTQIVLDVVGVTKSYGPTLALHDVALRVGRGEVHALVGENGAGKSTLVKILSGIVAPDHGAIEFEGAAFQPRSPIAARAAGVSTAFQELSLLTNLTVAENLALPQALKRFGGSGSRRANESHFVRILAEFGADDIAPDTIVGELTLAQKQRIEIVRAVSHRPRLLILDEPTAALVEPEWVFALVARVAAKGAAILYITHRLGEVRRLCTRVTVLRNGNSIGTFDVETTRDADIFGMLLGAAPVRSGPGALPKRDGTSRTAIAARNLSGEAIADLSFDVRAGEIVGVASLAGQGQRELFRILGGVAPMRGGRVELDGKPVNLASPTKAREAGIGFLPEERKTEGIFPDLATAANVSLPILDRLTRFGFVDRRLERDTVTQGAARVDLAPRFLDMKIAALSGGNQQKALIARVLLSGARHLVLFDPTRGVDVGTKQVIYGVIRQFAATGGGVLIHSTELTELVQLVHRCLVLYRGRILGEIAGDSLTEANLVSLVTGHGEVAR